MRKPSGGKIDMYGPYSHSLPIEYLPNTRIDYYDENTGKLLQQRWYGPDRQAIWDRDWDHGNKHKHTFPHDHYWDPTNTKKPRPAYVGPNGEKINLDYC